MSGCSEKCWIPARCEHGREMPPRGRSVPLGAYVPCDCYRSPFNLRHLYSVHDSTRYYSDPEGWAAHEAGCDQCNPSSNAAALE